MNKVLKALLLVGGLLLLVVGAIAAGVVLWFRANAGDLKSAAKRGIRQGTEFGHGKEPASCEREALTRVEACHGIMCQAEEKVFLDACFRAADADPHFCDGVPKGGIFASMGWVDGECQRLGMKKGDQLCTQLVQAVPEYCAK